MAINPVAIPLTISWTGGPTPSAPGDLLAALLAAVSATNPDYTANLPGSLIEDISSTNIGALVTIDQARIDAINSISPYGANPFVLAQQGAMYGLPQGQPTNTSVDIIFSGPAGYVIPAGFIVSDGNYQYITQDPAVIGTGGSSLAVYAVSSSSGSWTPLAGTVTQIASSVGSGYTITVTNPEAGTPGGPIETVESYRSRIIQAGQASAQGVPAMLLTALQAIPGVPVNLVSIIQTGGQFKVICGGGDPYQIALAIFNSFAAFPMLAISATSGRNITASIIVPPNTYSITFVNPVAQTVVLTATWNTQATNFTASAQVNQLGQAALLQYINSIVVGQPINLLQMTAIFQNAVSSVLSIDQIDALAFAVTVNGSLATPEAGTSIIIGDPEGYWLAAPSAVTVVQ